MTFHNETGSARYDKLRHKIKNEFNRAVTLTPSLSAAEQKTLIALDDHDETYALDSQFQKFGPFNAVYARNLSDYDIRLYLNENRNVYIDLPGGKNDAQKAIENVPYRYISFLRIENLNGTNPINEGDVLVQVGNEVDSEELKLLEMSGELNV